MQYSLSFSVPPRLDGLLRPGLTLANLILSPTILELGLSVGVLGARLSLSFLDMGLLLRSVSPMLERLRFLLDLED